MMNRKEFLESSLSLGAALFGFGAFSFAACGKDPSAGGDDDGNQMIDAGKTVDGAVDAPTKLDAGIDGPPPNCNLNGTTVGIGANHGHVMTVAKADITAGVEKTYKTISDLNASQGQGHVHSVKLTAADFTALKAGMTVTKKSCDASHEHQFAFKVCPMASVPAGKVCAPTDTCGSENGPAC